MEFNSPSDIESVRTLVNSKDPKVIYYHLEGCPYCVKTMAPWEEVKKMGYPYKFYKVESSAIPEEFEIHGFPQFHIREKNGSKRTVEGSKETGKELEKALKLKKTLGGTRKLRGRRASTRRFIRRVRK